MDKDDNTKKSQMFFWGIFGCLAILMLLIPDFVTNYQKNGDHLMRLELRHFHSAQMAYRAEQRPPAYAPDLRHLVEMPQGIKLLEESWLYPVKNGFSIRYRAYLPDHYYLIAERQVGPFSPGHQVVFCVDQSGIIQGMAKDGRIPSGDAQGCRGGIPVV